MRGKERLKQERKVMIGTKEEEVDPRETKQEEEKGARESLNKRKGNTNKREWRSKDESLNRKMNRNANVWRPLTLPSTTSPLILPAGQ